MCSHPLLGSLVCICGGWLSCLPATVHQSRAGEPKGTSWQDLEGVCVHLARFFLAVDMCVFLHDVCARPLRMNDLAYECVWVTHFSPLFVVSQLSWWIFEVRELFLSTSIIASIICGSVCCQGLEHLLPNNSDKHLTFLFVLFDKWGWWGRRVIPNDGVKACVSAHSANFALTTFEPLVTFGIQHPISCKNTLNHGREERSHNHFILKQLKCGCVLGFMVHILMLQPNALLLHYCERHTYSARHLFSVIKWPHGGKCIYLDTWKSPCVQHVPLKPAMWRTSSRS